MKVPTKPVKWWINDCEYMKIIYEYQSDFVCGEHYLSSSENKAHKLVMKPCHFNQILPCNKFKQVPPWHKFKKFDKQLSKYKQMMNISCAKSMTCSSF